MVAIPNDSLPFALVVKGWGQAKARALVTSHDLAYLDAAQTGILYPTQDNLNPLTSRADGVFALVSEYGLALAYPLTLAGTPVSIGITPKLQRVDTWNYNEYISHYSPSDFHIDEWKHSERGGNVDVGFFEQLTLEWTVGLTGRNWSHGTWRYARLTV